MSTLIFMSQRLFLTVLPALFPIVFAKIFSNIYIGAVVVIGLTFIFSILIIVLSKRSLFLKRLF